MHVNGLMLMHRVDLRCFNLALIFIEFFNPFTYVMYYNVCLWHFAGLLYKLCNLLAIYIIIILFQRAPKDTPFVLYYKMFCES